MSPARSRDRTFEREGTLDKLSELHTLQQTLATGRGDETADYDQEELETAAENLMQHLSVDQLGTVSFSKSLLFGQSWTCLCFHYRYAPFEIHDWIST